MLNTYMNTLLELRSIQERLKWLEDRRLVLYTEYLGVKSPNYDKIGGRKNWSIDGMSLYLEALEKVDEKTGLSLEKEIEMLTERRQVLTDVLKSMEQNLRKAKGIEFELFVLIVVDGMKRSQAVKEIAEKNYMAEQTVWRYYYPKIKEEIERLWRK